MRLRGLHAQKIETMSDALAKLASGAMTAADMAALQKLVSKNPGVPIPLPTPLIHAYQVPIATEVPQDGALLLIAPTDKTTP
jgi:hypothetical protein